MDCLEGNCGLFLLFMNNDQDLDLHSTDVSKFLRWFMLCNIII